MGLWFSWRHRAASMSRNRARGFRIPTPPEIACQCPQAFLNRSNKPVEHAGFTDDRRYLSRGLSQHADFIIIEGSCLFCLHDKHSLKDAAIDERYTQKGLVGILSRFAEVLEARMISGVFDGDRAIPARQPCRQDLRAAQAAERRCTPAAVQALPPVRGALDRAPAGMRSRRRSANRRAISATTFMRVRPVCLPPVRGLRVLP